ncbi:MAG TPA: hypothetical protein PLQ66_13805, partial [Anaerolineae bacterium]|nr:hypothetical protein [Anaerolineae bacterium]
MSRKSFCCGLIVGMVCLLLPLAGATSAQSQGGPLALPSVGESKICFQSDRDGNFEVYAMN